MMELSEASLRKTASSYVEFLEKKRMVYAAFVEADFDSTMAAIARHLAAHSSLSEDDILSGRVDIGISYGNLNTFFNVILDYLVREGRMIGNLTGREADGELEDRIAFIVYDGRPLTLETRWNQGAAAVFLTDFDERQWHPELATSFDELKTGVERMLRSPMNPLEG